MRGTRPKWNVRGALAVWLVLAIAIVLLFPRALADVTFAFLPVSAVIIWFGIRRESADGTFPHWSPVRGFLLLVVFLGVTCCAGPAAFYMINAEPLHPANSELLPLPGGLEATSNLSGPGWCGTGSCSRRFTVAGWPGQSPNEVSERVRQHLSRKGWNLDEDGHECRPAGLFFDQRRICVELYIRGGVVMVQFSGSRAGE